MMIMYDVIKVLLFFSAFFGLCVIGELIAEHAPWIGYIGAAALIVYGMSKLYIRSWK